MALQLKIRQLWARLFKMIKYALYIFFFISCNSEERIGERANVRVDGYFNSNGREDGQWQYFSPNKEIIEEGYFVDGIRIGIWKYYWPFKDSISWSVYKDTNNFIQTNIPHLLSLIESNDNIASFKSIDTSILFNLVIGKNYSLNFESYKSSIYDDLSRRDVKLIDTGSQYIETDKKKKYLYNYVSGIDDIGQKFHLFNIVGLGKEGNLIEISLRCDPKYDDKGRKVFFSIVPNLFIGSTRFLLYQENIALIENSLGK